MPEGDTLKKAAALLGVMTGQRVTGFESPLPALARNDALGATISSVEARGKNLLIWFDATRALYTHLRMEGSWHRYLPGTPWRKPARQAREILSTEAWIAVCFNSPVVEWLSAWQVARRLFAQPILVTIVLIEFCSGYFRQAVMQWSSIYAKQTGLRETVFIHQHWGMLCVAGILGGVLAGTISDHVFQTSLFS